MIHSNTSQDFKAVPFLCVLPHCNVQWTLLCTDRIHLPKKFMPVIALVHSYLVQAVLIHTGPQTGTTRQEIQGCPELEPLPPLHITILKYGILNRGFLHSYLLQARPMLKPLEAESIDRATEHCEGTRSPWGTLKQRVAAPGAGRGLSCFPHPSHPPWWICVRNTPATQPQFSQWSWFRIKLKQRKLMKKKKKKKTNQTHTSNIGLYLQKQPAIFGATAFKSSAWDILSAISMKAEHSQLPWKSASEVGAQYLSKPWRCFCKGKMLKLNHLQLRGTTQF